MKNQTCLLAPPRWRKRTAALGIGFGAALIAFACGSENNGGTPAEEIDPEPDEIRVDRPAPQTCDQNPLLAICLEPEVGRGDPDPVRPGSDPTIDPPDPDPVGDLAAVARAAAENILRANCGQCHGPALTEAQARAGMNFIDDVDRLVAETARNGQRLIDPLNSDGSLIVQRMRNGSMPPSESTGPRPSTQDIQTVANFIDNPNFWDARPQADCTGQEITYDDLYQRVQADLFTQDARDRPFTRYLSLTNRYNAGICSDALDADRWAMVKMVNMLSVNARITEPEAINREQTLYRIDIRDYDWDRAIEVNGQDFDDVWEAFIAIDPYAVPFVGDEADVVRLQSETDVALLNVDMLLDTAIIGNLYYAAIGVDIDQTLDEFIEGELGVDEAQNLDQEQVVRAGTTQSVLSRQDTLVQRQDIEVRTGSLWERFDFDANEDNQSIFSDVFDFQPGGSQAIFSLPNNLMGFVIADEDRNVVEESDILFDTFQNDFVVRTAVSCSQCHAQGYLPVVDQVRPFVERNRRDFNANDYELVQEVYPAASQFARYVEDDSELFRSALRRARIPTDVSDPVANAFIRFDLDVNLSTAAGDLGVRPDDLRRDLNRLDPALGILDGFTIDRDDFTNLYVASLCVMQSFSQNQPDRDVCDDAIDALDD